MPTKTPRKKTNSRSHDSELGLQLVKASNHGLSQALGSLSVQIGLIWYSGNR
jgi:hypothetical protein